MCKIHFMAGAIGIHLRDIRRLHNETSDEADLSDGRSCLPRFESKAPPNQALVIRHSLVRLWSLIKHTTARRKVFELYAHDMEFSVADISYIVH